MSYSLLRPATRALVVVLVCLVSSDVTFSQSTGAVAGPRSRSERRSVGRREGDSRQ